MRQCIFCMEWKEEKKFNREHIILEALGGKENIVEIDNCISRLRLILKDSAKVNVKALKATGSLGLIRINEENVQVVYGAKVEKAAAELKRAVKKAGGSAAEKHAGFPTSISQKGHSWQRST